MADNEDFEMKKKLNGKNIQKQSEIEVSLGNQNCSVCRKTISSNQNLVYCPFCNSPFHKEHFAEAIKTKGKCPICNIQIRTSAKDEEPHVLIKAIESMIPIYGEKGLPLLRLAKRMSKNIETTLDELELLIMNNVVRGKIETRGDSDVKKYMIFLKEGWNIKEVEYLILRKLENIIGEKILRRISNEAGSYYQPKNYFDCYLGNITVLTIGDKVLKSFPEIICRLTDLKWLTVDGNQFTTLPNSIGQLAHLEGLCLGNTQLKSLPKSIGRLTNLEVLNLDDNLLTSLPKSFGQLSKLKTLFLFNNHLTSLPENIGQLVNLDGFYLKNNQLTTLPESIGQLSSLKELYLKNNQLTSLPESIGQLVNLERLYLENNQLTSLPESIGQLVNLDRLYLENNQLTTLPESIGQLSSLQELYLENNRLTTLPESIGQLTSLLSISLENNRLTTLPESISKLTKLRNYFDIFQNASREYRSTF